MDINQLRATSAGLFCIFIFLTGFWLRRSGKPYHTILFNLHKLIGVAAGVSLVVTVVQVHRATPLSSVEITAAWMAVLFFIGAIASGGLVSIARPMPAAIKLAHKALPYFTALFSVLTLYLLLNRG